MVYAFTMKENATTAIAISILVIAGCTTKTSILTAITASQTSNPQPTAPQTDTPNPSATPDINL